MTALALLGLMPDPFAAGLRAYREGRFPEALASFRQAEEAAGAAASAALLYNKALAALGAGDLLESESSAEKAAARGGPGFIPLRNFLLGNAAFARCELVEAQAATPGSPPFAYDAALALANTARHAWQLAAMSRPDWPQARRNVERALLKAAALAKKKAEAVQEKALKLPGRARVLLVPGEGEEAGDEEAEQAPKAQPEAANLSPQELKGFFELLDRKEKEKLELRRAGRRERQGGAEKDW